MRILAGTVAISLFSIGAAHAQAPEPANTDNTCVYAGETYSQGASICVTDTAGLTCDSQGHWTAASNFDPSHCGSGLNRSSDDENRDSEDQDHEDMMHH